MLGHASKHTSQLPSREVSRHGLIWEQLPYLGAAAGLRVHWPELHEHRLRLTRGRLVEQANGHVNLPQHVVICTW